MNQKINNVLSIALESLEKELKSKPLSPDRVATLTEVIKVLSNVSSLSRL